MGFPYCYKNVTDQNSHQRKVVASAKCDSLFRPRLRASPEGGELVYVEQQPREVADEKDDDEAHEDGGEVVFLLAPRLVCHTGRRGRR